MKTSELIGPTLDWAVAKCSGDETRLMFRGDSEAGVSDVHFDPWHAPWSPSTDWNQGGPIIEREGINIFKYNKLDEREPDKWCGHKAVLRRAMDGFEYTAALALDGPTPLIAAMRAFVASRLGDEVEIPEELK